MFSTLVLTYLSPVQTAIQVRAYLFVLGVSSYSLLYPAAPMLRAGGKRHTQTANSETANTKQTKTTRMRIGRDKGCGKGGCQKRSPIAGTRHFTLLVATLFVHFLNGNRVLPLFHPSTIAFCIVGLATQIKITGFRPWQEYFMEFFNWFIFFLLDFYTFYNFINGKKNKQFCILSHLN